MASLSLPRLFLPIGKHGSLCAASAGILLRFMLKASIGDASGRDVKGLYKKAGRGRSKILLGLVTPMKSRRIPNCRRYGAPVH